MNRTLGKDTLKEAEQRLTAACESLMVKDCWRKQKWKKAVDTFDKNDVSFNFFANFMVFSLPDSTVFMF